MYFKTSFEFQEATFQNVLPHAKSYIFYYFSHRGHGNVLIVHFHYRRKNLRSLELFITTIYSILNQTLWEW